MFDEHDKRKAEYERFMNATRGKRTPDSIEAVIADLKRLEADPLVRLADEEEDLRDCLKQIRDTLKKKQDRGRELEAMGVTIELVRRYRKDYAETEDWGC